MKERWLLEVSSAAVYNEHGEHVYLSTGCLHGEHDYCKGLGGIAGPKEPACCKFCQAPCVCNCHQQEAE